MANTKIPSELVAINAISGTLIADNAITSVHIAENNITATQIAINAVTALQMADGTITSAKIADGTIVTADIADGQITTGKLADSSVTTGKIAAGTILSSDIANNAILTQHIDDNQITADQIADNAVGLNQLASLSRGSLIYGNSAGNPAYLAAGTSGHVLTSDGTDISWTADTDLFLASSGGTVSGDTSINRGNQTSGELLLGGTTDGGFVDFDGTNLQLNTQRDPNTGTFVNTGKSNARIEISGPSGGSHIAFRTIASNNTSASERMRIDKDGKVGIGTTAPVTTLQINPSSGGYNLFFDRGNSTPGGANPWLGLFNATTVSAATYGWGFYDSSSDGSLQIWNRNNSTTGANALTIKRGGDVGIGGDAPAAKLEVKDGGNDYTSGILLRKGSSTSETTTLYHDNSSATTTVLANRYGSDNARISLLLKHASGSPVNALTAMGTGNVGIGTNNPAMILDVDGSSAANDIARFSGPNSGGITFRNATSNEFIMHTATNDALIFGTNGNTERMRIGAGGAIDIANNQLGWYSNTDSAWMDGTMRFSNLNFKNAGGTTRMYIAGSTGKVGIGIGSGAVSRLHVRAPQSDTMTAANAFAAFDGTGGDGIIIGARASSPFGAYIQSGYTPNIGTSHHYPLLLNPHGGNVGIGTASPSAPLHITHGTPSIKFTDSSSSANYSMTLDGVTVNNTNAGTNGSIAFHTHNGEKLRLGATNSYFSNTNVGIGTASPAYKFDVYGTDDITMRIHRPSSGLAETDTCGIGFSHRGDANTSTSDTRAAIVSTYNGSLYLCTEPSGNLNANPVDHAALAITGTNQSVTIGTCLLYTSDAADE